MADMPPESEKVLTVYRCRICGFRSLTAEHLHPPHRGETDVHHPDDMEPVRYLPEAETVPREVAEGLAMAIEPLVNRGQVHQWFVGCAAISPAQLARQREIVDAVNAALHTYRQSVPEREETTT